MALPMTSPKQYFVYLITNRSGTLYTGVTNDLVRRVYEHKQKRIPGFTARYNIDRLVHYEVTPSVRSAISREKEIKGWRRSTKLQLISETNPAWTDLASSRFDDPNDLKAPHRAPEIDSSLRSE